MNVFTPSNQLIREKLKIPDEIEITCSVGADMTDPLNDYMRITLSLQSQDAEKIGLGWFWK